MTIKNKFSLLFFFLSIFPFSEASCSESSSSTETGPILVAQGNESFSAEEIEKKIKAYRGGWASIARKPTRLTITAPQPQRSRGLTAQDEVNTRKLMEIYKENPSLVPPYPEGLAAQAVGRIIVEKRRTERRRKIRGWANYYKKNPHFIPLTDADLEKVDSIQRAGLEQMLRDKDKLASKKKTKKAERKQSESATTIQLKLPRRTSPHQGTISRSSASLNLTQALLDSDSGSSLRR